MMTLRGSMAAAAVSLTLVAALSWSAGDAAQSQQPADADTQVTSRSQPIEDSEQSETRPDGDYTYGDYGYGDYGYRPEVSNVELFTINPWLRKYLDAHPVKQRPSPPREPQPESQPHTFSFDGFATPSSLAEGTWIDAETGRRALWVSGDGTPLVDLLSFSSRRKTPTKPGRPVQQQTPSLPYHDDAPEAPPWMSMVFDAIDDSLDQFAGDPQPKPALSVAEWMRTPRPVEMTQRDAPGKPDLPVGTNEQAIDGCQHSCPKCGYGPIAEAAAIRDFSPDGTFAPAAVDAAVPASFWQSGAAHGTGRPTNSEVSQAQDDAGGNAPGTSAELELQPGEAAAELLPILEQRGSALEGTIFGDPEYLAELSEQGVYDARSEFVKMIREMEAAQPDNKPGLLKPRTYDSPVRPQHNIGEFRPVDAFERDRNFQLAETAEFTAAPISATANGDGPFAVEVLRGTAEELERSANLLERKNLFQQADQLRGMAAELRGQARALHSATAR